MQEKIKVGILGATGAVGQNYAILLENHPWFEVTYLAASPNSAGKIYSDALTSKWFMNKDIPPNLRNIVVGDAASVDDAVGKCALVFSAFESDKDTIRDVELKYAANGFKVVSNNSVHRSTPNVPVIIPEINYSHLDIINSQRKNYGWDKGLLVVKPNCSIQSYLLPVYALLQAGYSPKRMIVSTEQASSGAGYPGVPFLDLIDNIVPYIGGEDEKTENEPLKVLGSMINGKIENYHLLKISATCTRVPVSDGHTAIVNLEFADKKPALDEIIDIWQDFRSYPQSMNLPFAPEQPITYRSELNRPQPKKDRDAGKGMAVTVGRLRECDVFDIKFVGLSHNTIRGAAGGAILTAETLYSLGYL